MSYLLAKDTVNGAEGSIVLTQDGVNTVVASMKNIQTNAEIQSNDMKVVGTRKIQNKNAGAKLTGTGNVYYGTDLFRDMVLEYIETGSMPEFSIQITNSDPTTTIGTQIMAFYGCTLTGTIPLAILNSEEAMLAYDFNFAFTDVAKLSSFTDPTTLGS